MLLTRHIENPLCHSEIARAPRRPSLSAKTLFGYVQHVTPYKEISPYRALPPSDPSTHPSDSHDPTRRQRYTNPITPQSNTSRRAVFLVKVFFLRSHTPCDSGPLAKKETQAESSGTPPADARYFWLQRGALTTQGGLPAAA